MHFILLAVAAVAAGAPSGAPSAAPIAALVQPSTARLTVFLDCDACDDDFVRTEITFVSYVQDRESADLHVLVTSQITGAEGQAFTMTFLGRRALAGQDQTLSVVTEANDSADRVRRALTHTLRLGLLRYVAGTAVAPDVEVNFAPSASNALAPRRDPWNHWIVAMSANTALERQDSQSTMEIEAAVSADRTTDHWKISVGGEVGYNEERFDLDEGDEIRSVLQDRELNVLVVKSLGRHWSVGARVEIESSTFENTRIGVVAAPAVEYDLFPYDEATRRELRIQYAVGPQYTRYREETVFGKMRESRVAHELSAVLDRQEPWGTTRASLEWSQYLDDLSKNRLEASLDLSLRVTRGLSLTVALEGSRIRDQVSLPARGATPQEILLQQRQLASGHELTLSLAIAYRFGSLFSPIVNPRFGR